MEDFFAFVVSTTLRMIFSSSVDSEWRISCSAAERNYEACNRSSQYRVSSHSFCAMVILWMKSLVDCPFNASLTFAPIDIPDLKSWEVSTNSFSFARSERQSFDIRTANSKLLFWIMLSFMENIYTTVLTHSTPSPLVHTHTYQLTTHY